MKAVALGLGRLEQRGFERSRARADKGRIRLVQNIIGSSEYQFDTRIGRQVAPVLRFAE